MPLFDLPAEDLKKYKPNVELPADFDAFWKSTLQEARNAAKPLRRTAYSTPLKTVGVFDLTFSGYAGQDVKAWFLVPHGLKPGEKIPCVVQFIGYGGGRAYPQENLFWPSSGFAFLLMDTRGQGSNWSRGDTADPEPEGSSPHYPGFLTKGILDKQTYYYRRVFTDAVRALETAAALPEVDPKLIFVSGASQGGGISLAAAGLAGRFETPGLPQGLAGVMADVPFLCHFRRAVEITDEHPYGELVSWLKTHREEEEKAFETLAYFDGVNFSKGARAPSCFSVSLMDKICPPSTVYAAYNHYAGPKEIKQYTFNGHEGGGALQDISKVEWAQKKAGIV